MRILIKLRCSESGQYEMQYHYHLQGFIYNLLKGSQYEHIHDKEGYKFFCFSNIFPATKNLKQYDLHNLIISSPDTEFIAYLYEVMQHSLNKSDIRIGSMKFRIDYVDQVAQEIKNNVQVALITGTPIIVRIPSQKYKEYEFQPKKGYGYIYWRREHPIDLFISQVQDNLLRKYYEFQYCKVGYDIANHTENIMKPKTATSSCSSIPLFQELKFKKQISTKVTMKGFDQIIVGTVWEFSFNKYANRELIQFALDSGLGERNSLGFGFMNLII